MADSETPETGYWVAFNRVAGVGPIKTKRLYDYFGSLAQAWQARASELAAAGLESRALEAVLAARERVSPAREVDLLHQRGVRAITLADEDYPERLRQIYAPPAVLYVHGEIIPGDELAVAVVGTRRATMYGREAAERLAADLAANRVTVVSGLARGVDTVAHRAAVDVGGRTVAVLGSGLDVIYPAENKRLAEAIREQGAVVSEYPLGTKPDAANFPPRNRIISGLSLGTLVVEAGEESGALITADFALEQNREVLAVPGPIFARTSRGTNKLIQQGAKLVLCAQDILDELNLTSAPQQLEMRELLAAEGGNAVEVSLLKVLSQEPQHIDEVCRQSGLAIADVSSALAMMELKGLVRQLGGMHYVLGR
ncbi:MAG: DNA-processing protein DprA [Dehalococcoidales bacterium]|nr:DNA-processing protein DprA [Dehalococcoidales bacterium]